jgi:phosphoribosyl-AMP cyclohydrolase
MIRQIARVVFSGILMGAFVSCWDNFEEQTYYSANVLSFSFAEQDTCPGIEDYTFYIDQFNGLIYNIDSLPFGSKVDYLVPSITVQSTNGQIYINDSLWESTDTLDFTHPVRLANTSSDGRYTRTYTIYVNVHQVDPDTLLVEEKSTLFPAVSYRNKVFMLDDGNVRAYFPSAEQGFEVYQSDKTQTFWSKLPVSGLTRIMDVNSICLFNNAYVALDQAGLLYRSTNGLDWSSDGNSLRFKALFGSLNRQYKSDSNLVYLVGLLVDSAGVVRFAQECRWKQLDIRR